MPLWPETRYLLGGDSYARLLAALQDLSSGPGAELTKDPVRAAVMQHDLWAVFDSAVAERADACLSTGVALVRRMTLIPFDGTTRRSPLVETVQLRTFHILQ